MLRVVSLGNREFIWLALKIIQDTSIKSFIWHINQYWSICYVCLFLELALEELPAGEARPPLARFAVVAHVEHAIEQAGADLAADLRQVLPELARLASVPAQNWKKTLPYPVCWCQCCCIAKLPAVIPVPCLPNAYPDIPHCKCRQKCPNTYLNGMNDVHPLWLLEEGVQREVGIARQREVLQGEGEHVLRAFLLVRRLGQLFEAQADVQDAVDEDQVRFLLYLPDC